MLAVPAGAALLLWPALWNGFPIVFADTGTYLSQAIHHYAGWDRPVFYSLFMLPLHLTLTVWPVIVVQALLAAWVLWLVFRVLLADASAIAFVAGLAVLSAFTWLPWLVCELMPDLFTPLLVLVVCLLACAPARLSPGKQIALAGFAAFMIASQLSSLPLAWVLGAALLACVKPASHLAVSLRAGSVSRAVGLAAVTRRGLLVFLPPVVAVVATCSVNLAAHGRFAPAPFGNIFLLARVIYDGPGMAVLRRDCPTHSWLLCPFLDGFPPTSDDFLWTSDSPLYRAGGPKLVSQDAGAIIDAALLSDPVAEGLAILDNTVEQITRFASGDGFNPWPVQVSPWIEVDFPTWEYVAYMSARQQRGVLAVPALLSSIHMITALVGVTGCAMLLPVAFRRRAVCSGFLLAVLVALPMGAAITGGLSAPHDRYQARLMWLPPFVAVISLAALRRRPA